MPFHLDHVWPGVDGCKYLKISTTEHASKRPRRAEELSRDVSDGSEPRLSRALSKTVLKSPHSMEGTEKSILTCRSRKKESRAGLRLGTYREHTRNDMPRKENSHWRYRPSASHQESETDNESLKRMTHPAERTEPGEHTTPKPED